MNRKQIEGHAMLAAGIIIICLGTYLVTIDAERNKPASKYGRHYIDMIEAENEFAFYDHQQLLLKQISLLDDDDNDSGAWDRERKRIMGLVWQPANFPAE